MARAADGTDALLDRASWIWWDKDTNAIQPPYKESEFTFTKEIAIAGEVRQATLRVTAESAYQLLVNDKPVGADEAWQTLETYDIKPLLVTGKNRLLVKARSKSWFAGLFVAGAAVRSPERLLRLPAAPVAQPGVRQGEAILRPIHEAKASARVGQAVRFAIPFLPAGSYFLDVQVSDGGKRVTWGTVALVVTSKFGIGSLALDPPTLDIADGKSARLRATARLTGIAPAGASVAFTLVDNYDRMLATKTVAVPEGSARAEATFPVKTFATTLGKVRAELLAGADTPAVAVGRFTTVRRDWDRFLFFGWAATPASIPTHGWASIARCGLFRARATTGTRSSKSSRCSPPTARRGRSCPPRRPAPSPSRGSYWVWSTAATCTTPSSAAKNSPTWSGSTGAFGAASCAGSRPRGGTS
jgi:hypothetical protein